MSETREVIGAKTVSQLIKTVADAPPETPVLILMDDGRTCPVAFARTDEGIVVLTSPENVLKLIDYKRGAVVD